MALFDVGLCVLCIVMPVCLVRPSGSGAAAPRFRGAEGERGRPPNPERHAALSKFSRSGVLVLLSSCWPGEHLADHPTGFRCSIDAGVTPQKSCVPYSPMFSVCPLLVGPASGLASFWTTYFAPIVMIVMSDRRGPLGLPDFLRRPERRDHRLHFPPGAHFWPSCRPDLRCPRNTPSSDNFGIAAVRQI